MLALHSCATLPLTDRAASPCHRWPTFAVMPVIKGGKRHYEHTTHLFISFSGTVLRLVTKVRRCALFNKQKLHSYVQPRVCSEHETHSYT